MDTPCPGATGSWWWGQGVGIQVAWGPVHNTPRCGLDPMSHCHEVQHSARHLLRHSTR